jgi:hypothetical protein
VLGARDLPAIASEHVQDFGSFNDASSRHIVSVIERHTTAAIRKLADMSESSLACHLCLDRFCS